MIYDNEHTVLEMFERAFHHLLAEEGQIENEFTFLEQERHFDTSHPLFAELMELYKDVMYMYRKLLANDSAYCLAPDTLRAKLEESSRYLLKSTVYADEEMYFRQSIPFQQQTFAIFEKYLLEIL